MRLDTHSHSFKLQGARSLLATVASARHRHGPSIDFGCRGGRGRHHFWSCFQYPATSNRRCRACCVRRRLRCRFRRLQHATTCALRHVSLLRRRRRRRQRLKPRALFHSLLERVAIFLERLRLFHDAESLGHLLAQLICHPARLEIGTATMPARAMRCESLVGRGSRIQQRTRFGPFRQIIACAQHVQSAPVTSLTAHLGYYTVATDGLACRDESETDETLPRRDPKCGRVPRMRESTDGARLRLRQTCAENTPLEGELLRRRVPPPHPVRLTGRGGARAAPLKCRWGDERAFSRQLAHGACDSGGAGPGQCGAQV